MKCAYLQSAHRHWQANSYLSISRTLPDGWSVGGSGQAASGPQSDDAAICSSSIKPAAPAPVAVVRQTSSRSENEGHPAVLGWAEVVKPIVLVHEVAGRRRIACSAETFTNLLKQFAMA